MAGAPVRTPAVATHLRAAGAAPPLADRVVARQYLDTLPTQGYNCIDAHEGRQCQGAGKDTHYPVDVADTLFLRGDVYVTVYQANFPTNGLIAQIVAALWP